MKTHQLPDPTTVTLCFLDADSEAMLASLLAPDAAAPPALGLPSPRDSKASRDCGFLAMFAEERPIINGASPSLILLATVRDRVLTA